MRRSSDAVVRCFRSRLFHRGLAPSDRHSRHGRTEPEFQRHGRQTDDTPRGSPRLLFLCGSQRIAEIRGGREQPHQLRCAWPSRSSRQLGWIRSGSRRCGLRLGSTPGGKEFRWRAGSTPAKPSLRKRVHRRRHDAHRVGFGNKVIRFLETWCDLWSDSRLRCRSFHGTVSAWIISKHILTTKSVFTQPRPGLTPRR